MSRPRQQPKKVKGKPAKKKGQGSTASQLRAYHGLDTGRANPSDDAEHDQRVRRGLDGENSRAFGGIAARGAITARVRGDAMGRRDERRKGPNAG